MPAPRSSWRMGCVGSLCLIDTEPRLVADQISRLHDLTDLAVQELERG